MDNKELPLSMEIKDGQLVISIGINTLAFATGVYITDFKIINNEGFAKDILNELDAEEEDGSTMVHRMFDTAANNAIENGSEAVEEISGDQEDN